MQQFALVGKILIPQIYIVRLPHDFVGYYNNTLIQSPYSSLQVFDSKDGSSFFFLSSSLGPALCSNRSIFLA